jgi:hypothetical protein
MREDAEKLSNQKGKGGSTTKPPPPHKK